MVATPVWSRGRHILSDLNSKTKVDVNLKYKVVLWPPRALSWCTSPVRVQHYLRIILTLKAESGRLHYIATLCLKNQVYTYIHTYIPTKLKQTKPNKNISMEAEEMALPALPGILVASSLRGSDTATRWQSLCILVTQLPKLGANL